MHQIQRQVLIVGARGYGREVLRELVDHHLAQGALTVGGFLDSKSDALDGYGRDIGVVGDPQHYRPKPNQVFIVALGSPADRYKYSSALREVHDADFLTLVNPGTRVPPNTLARGCIVGPWVGMSCDVRVGEFTCIQPFTTIGHDVDIGSWCQINPHCTIGGGARIGDFVSIHPHCVIVPGAVIGNHVTVGAGSVVVGRIPDGMTVMGNPARRFDFRAAETRKIA